MQDLMKRTVSPIAVYSSGSTLVPCGSTQRDTRLCLPGESRLFGMGLPLHARIIVNSKAAQKPAFYLSFPARFRLSQLDAPA